MFAIFGNISTLIFLESIHHYQPPLLQNHLQQSNALISFCVIAKIKMNLGSQQFLLSVLIFNQRLEVPPRSKNFRMFIAFFIVLFFQNLNNFFDFLCRKSIYYRTASLVSTTIISLRFIPTINLSSLLKKQFLLFLIIIFP